jgi:hypothetical protein
MTDRHPDLRPSRPQQPFRTAVWEVLPEKQYTALYKLRTALRRKEAQQK